jgi:hypothetical protein
LFLTGGDSHAFERAVEPNVDVEVAGILMTVEKRPGPPREVAPLALPQPGELAQSRK